MTTLIPETIGVGAELSSNNAGAYSSQELYGFTENIGSSWRDIWNVAQDKKTLASAPSLISISSTSPDDSVSGAGTRRVLLIGLSPSQYNQTEVVELNGTTPVVTTKQFFSVFRLVGFSAGAASGNVGVITARRQSDSEIEAQISSTLGEPDSRSLNTHFATTPITKAFVEQITITTDTTQSVAVKLNTQSINGGPIINRAIYTQVRGTNPIRLSSPLVINPGNYFWASAIRQSGSVSVSLAVTIPILLRDELANPVYGSTDQ